MDAETHHRLNFLVNSPKGSSTLLGCVMDARRLSSHCTLSDVEPVNFLLQFLGRGALSIIYAFASGRYRWL